MIDNIQKLYEIAGVKEKRGVELTVDAKSEELKFNEHNVCYGYPPFTTEKQLELIKWLLHHKQTTQVELRYFGNSYYVSHCTKSKDKGFEYERNGKARLFENSIADLFCDMWESLTDDQKQEIKRILE